MLGPGRLGKAHACVSAHPCMSTYVFCNMHVFVHVHTAVYLIQVVDSLLHEPENLGSAALSLLFHFSN